MVKKKKGWVLGESRSTHQDYIVQSKDVCREPCHCIERCKMSLLESNGGGVTWSHCTANKVGMFCFMQKLDFQSKMSESSGGTAVEMREQTSPLQSRRQADAAPPCSPEVLYSVLRLARVWLFWGCRFWRGLCLPCMPSHVHGTSPDVLLIILPQKRVMLCVGCASLHHLTVRYAVSVLYSVRRSACGGCR